VNIDADMRLADRVLLTLERAKYLHPQASLRELMPLRDEVGSGQGVENERAEAWLAIAAILKTLSEAPGHRDMPNLWQKATDKTAAWLAALKGPAP